ncbi:Acyltransferase [Ancylostoma duodenale]|uniref:1-acylglycerol-3-phosphate O-acyltransferase n=1 Tax=Ancylostoma duodenale TaxID=51022 RepID=A0A0C2HJ49_9BILA|nr:Acyltransferase [Ancylostoma duodenale]
MAGTIGAIISIPYGRSTNNHLNKQYIDSDKPFVIIANHQSALDVLGMSYCWPKNCAVMLKSSLKFLPGFNLCAYMCNSIWINRFSKEKAHKAVDMTLAAIIEHQIPVVCCVFSSHSFFYDAAERRLDSGECLVEFLPPVDPAGFESVDDLSNHCRNLMMLKHEELNKELRDKLSKKQN